MSRVLLLVLLLGALIAACSPSATPTSIPAQAAAATATWTPQPSRTPLPPTSAFPPTAANNDPQNAASSVILLQNGRGLSTGRTVNNGEFEVEAYCSLLNSAYGVREDGQHWYCTEGGVVVRTLRTEDFSEICRRTYDNPNAVAVHDGSTPFAYGWRCYEYRFTPTPAPTVTPQPTPSLLQNGRGLSTGRTVNNGEFEVEGYCNMLNSTFGVREDGTNWYCTQQSSVVLTLQNQHFDDICRRTYGTAYAFAARIDNSDPPAYRWRCYTMR